MVVVALSRPPGTARCQTRPGIYFHKLALTPCILQKFQIESASGFNVSASSHVCELSYFA
eukprot:1569363-Pyramimonas_sp.AAC.1